MKDYIGTCISTAFLSALGATTGVATANFLALTGLAIVSTPAAAVCGAIALPYFAYKEKDKI